MTHCVLFSLINSWQLILFPLFSINWFHCGWDIDAVVHTIAWFMLPELVIPTKDGNGKNGNIWIGGQWTTGPLCSTGRLSFSYKML